MTVLIKESTITPQVLKHMDHLEDLIYYGKNGAEMAFNILEDVFSLLKSEVPPHGSKVSTKWDGSPAVVAARDFKGEKFFSLKHSWDKGKRFHSPEEIDLAYPEDSQETLRTKLKTLLKFIEMMDLPKDEIWMGDFLFSPEDLEFPEIDGEPYVTFRPNTVVYAVPQSDPLFNKISKSDLGIVWHTVYTGEDFSSLKKNFSPNLDRLTEVPSVFQPSSSIPFNQVLFSQEESSVIDYKMGDLKKSLQELENDPNFELIISDKKLVSRMQKYKNKVIRDYHVEVGDLMSPSQLINQLLGEEDAHIESLTRESFKEASRKKKESFKKFLEGISVTLDKLYQVQEKMVDLKNIFVERIEKALRSPDNPNGSLRTFYQSLSRGYIPCGGEGFVISDVDGNVTKLVSRLDFSLSNWQEDIIKGWMTDKRSSSIASSKSSKGENK